MVSSSAFGVAFPAFESVAYEGSLLGHSLVERGRILNGAQQCHAIDQLFTIERSGSMASGGWTDDDIGILRRLLGSPDLMNCLVNHKASGSMEEIW